jgi:deoxyadenosine/deoxycytidine kinase
MKYPFITIEGNIGSGKTTLATLLAKKLGANLILETFENNPFLARFYEEPERYAMPVELFFLCERCEHLKNQLAITVGQPAISDYSLIKSLIFAEVTMHGDERAVYERIFHIANPTVPQADLTIYLHNKVDNLLENIRLRGRPYEQNIPAEYLQKVEASYLEYYKKHSSGRVLIVNVESLDFLYQSGDVQRLLAALEKDYAEGVHYLNLV